MYIILERLFGRPGSRLSTLVMVLLDVVFINAAFVVAYWLRYEVEFGGTVEEANFVPLSAFLPVQVSLTLITILVFLTEGLYRGPHRPSWPNQLSIIIRGTIIAVAVLIVIVFIFQPYFFSRLIFAQAWALMVVFLGLARLLEDGLRGMLRRRGIGVVRLLLVGAGDVGRSIMQSLVAQPGLGYDVVGFVDDDREKLQDIGRFKALGATADIPRLVSELAVDEVIITLPWLSHGKVLAIMSHCQKRGVQVKVVPDLFQISMNQVDIDELNGIPLIGLREPSLQVTSQLVKRGIDILVSLVALIGLSPVLIVTALAIVVDSPGPVIFPQVRVGQGGRTFTLYKFRSMRTGADEEKDRLRQVTETNGVTFKLKVDPRRTRVGRLIRRTSLDELPQFYNVLRGEMSLVGPRPAIPSEVEHYEDWHRKRMLVKPGLTGLWQVMGRSELPFEEMVMLDVFYIENWSLPMDLKILLRTVPSVLSGRGAY
ncbi:MAG: sugar transferase [Chloroflexota bacterium]|nr:sugar transferase [Chloroflexota bacterium]